MSNVILRNAKPLDDLGERVLDSRMSKALSPDQVRALLREAVGDSQTLWARAHGISPAYVSDTLSGKRDPAGKILCALGLTKTVAYVKASA